jgi:arylsulfatase A-like enzyme
MDEPSPSGFGGNRCIRQYREETFARQKKMGVIPKTTRLTDRHDSLPAWDSLSADQKKLSARMMERVDVVASRETDAYA